MLSTFVLLIALITTAISLFSILTQFTKAIRNAIRNESEGLSYKAAFIWSLIAALCWTWFYYLIH